MILVSMYPTYHLMGGNMELFIAWLILIFVCVISIQVFVGLIRWTWNMTISSKILVAIILFLLLVAVSA